MLATFPQPLEVEQIGGASFLEGLAGPALVALAAVLAAGLAAWVARKNHGQQLKHDGELRNLSHARRSLAAAVETVADAIDAVGHLSGAVYKASALRDRVDEVEASNDEYL